MRTVTKSLTAIVLGLLLTGCGRPAYEQTAIDFSKALAAGDIDTAMSYMSSEINVLGRDKVKGMITMAANEARREGQLDPDAKLTVVGSEVNEAGDMAKVSLRYDKTGEETELELVLEGDEWKISIGKMDQK